MILVRIIITLAVVLMPLHCADDVPSFLASAINSLDAHLIEFKAMSADDLEELRDPDGNLYILNDALFADRAKIPTYFISKRTVDGDFPSREPALLSFPLALVEGEPIFLPRFLPFTHYLGILAEDSGRYDRLSAETRALFDRSRVLTVAAQLRKRRFMLYEVREDNAVLSDNDDNAVLQLTQSEMADLRELYSNFRTGKALPDPGTDLAKKVKGHLLQK